MTRFEALVGLNMVADIGSIRLKRLLDYFDSPQGIFKASPDKLMSVSGIGRHIAAKIHTWDEGQLDKEFLSAKKLGLEIINYEGRDYPQSLKNIPGQPIVLYVKGKINPADKWGIAIVGSRRASFYGLVNAERFAYNLSAKGFTIISGMARGVDAAAHRGALKAGGRTMAVMGSGFDHIYPPQNIELAQDIARNGAVISEFSINTLPLRQNFPRRNRVISGLSLGTLVVEAARNSGALITADFALEQGREVFAIPGEVNSNTSFGTNGLIKQGAKLVSCVEDILEEFDTSIVFSADSGPSVNSGSSVACPGINPELKQDASIRDTQYTIPDLSQAELILYNALSKDAVSLDELVEKTSLSISRISGIILQLQLKRLIRQLPGKQLARRDNERSK